MDDKSDDSSFVTVRMYYVDAMLPDLADALE
jgi:hypothetical protein